MDRSPFACALAIIDLGVSYLSFTEQQYFSPFAMLSIFALAALSTIIFLLAYKEYFDKGENGPTAFTLSLGVSLALAYYSLTFNLISPQVLNAAIRAASLVGLAVVISIVSIYTVGRSIKDRMQRNTSYTLYLEVLVYLAIATALAYGTMYVFYNTNWNGVDELAYNYYASYLFLHGVNPYTQSMAPILNARGIYPSVLLNGSYEYAYDYPALSFLAYLPVTALGITSPYSFVAVLIFLSILASTAIYWKSGFNKEILVPIAAWLFLSFSLVSVSNTFLAVSTFLLFAYIFKNNPPVSGLLLGLGASVTQVAWFALPFFYVLMLRQHGSKAALSQFVVSAAVFLTINSYFIITAPSATIGNIFALLGTSKLPFYGPNIMQFFVSFYSVPFSYSALISVLFGFWSLAVFYFYTKSAKLFLALVPAMIFFLSWRNITIYAVPYVPLMLLMHYHRDGYDERSEDLIHSRKPMVYALLAIILVSFAAMVYMHSAYANMATLHINKVLPIVYVNQSVPSIYRYSLGGMIVNISNNGPKNETISFLIVSRSPNAEGYVLGTTQKRLGPGSVSNYTLNYRLPAINNSTKLFVVAFSVDYVDSRTINFTRLGAGFAAP